MASRPAPRRSACPLNAALEALGDRWSLLIVRDIAFNGASTYRDFLEAGESISTNVLADRLRLLERQGIVLRVEDPDDRRRARYTLSPKGLELLPAIVELVLWGAKHFRTAAPAALLREMSANRERFIAGVRERLRAPARPDSGTAGQPRR